MWRQYARAPAPVSTPRLGVAWLGKSCGAFSVAAAVGLRGDADRMRSSGSAKHWPPRLDQPLRRLTRAIGAVTFPLTRAGILIVLREARRTLIVEEGAVLS